ncbi:sulfate reduction electron transfer complex DsrMKJOP subunit DsrM [Desulfobaculum bizertense]|uniref:Putative sulfite reductase-associated electron transfer protein DsrM n=1 Tax=Desulfobaculum bizertense DSM 18034 TaxID=1121442 RepID=A0A1T4VDI6_9BACT|nr:sulfate reduction electron transfer complex DsrMKJOP subunit DsrM [Desulfobaculum bizertense]UIJ37616.1 sulfate reduction electron transfer complex DsrMKJOP subunit DsrM [Desulfobaculum bizertense]SKA63024.1 putative sulfite reductase-associated electron transfer protein DsrM [Desulfobaculum bizertense DSM 18034]
MNALYSLFLVFALALIALLGAGAMGMHTLFGVIIPYLAIALFFGGAIAKVIGWAKTPVPFRIPTTAGQQLSHDWIKHDKYDNPATGWQVFVRMVLEVLFFRSLFRNLAVQRFGSASDGVDAKVRYASAKWLWAFALLFHYSFLIVFVRHFRLFTDPVPGFLLGLEWADGFLQLGAPTLYITDLTLVAGVTLLLLRRVLIPQLRYISLLADYFPLFLILSIAGSGILMRYFAKTDIIGVKEITMGLFSFSPVVPSPEIGVIFYIHLFLVCVLISYFPFSKLMHMGGVFLSPTRNLANNNRAKRHVNPWNDPSIKAHSYADYEDDYRQKMVDAGLPVEKPLEETEKEA